MKIHFLLNERVHAEPNPIFAAAMALLRQRGFIVTSGIAEEALLSPDELDAEHDLYVLKSQTELALSVAGVLHDRGGRFVNPYPACALLQNKITAAGRLAASRVPVPRSWVTGDLALLHELAAAHPLVIKPYRGHRGAGVVVIRSPADLAALPPPAQPLLVQQFIAGAGGDLKVYVAGDQVFAVRKPFSDSSFRGTGVPCAVTAQVRDIALRCGRAFGLGLYGIDIIESADGPVVVDLNYSPGFRGVADAASPIARYIEDFAHARTTLPVNPPALRVTAWAGFLAQAAA
jgi:ribosomal protein S6--L-glutamate ligase